jgi:hypothetical protein
MRTDKIIKEATDEKLIQLLNCLTTHNQDFSNPDLILTKVTDELILRGYDLKNLFAENKEIKLGIFFKSKDKILLEDTQRVITVQDIGASFLCALELKGPTNDRIGRSFSRN